MTETTSTVSHHELCPGCDQAEGIRRVDSNIICRHVYYVSYASCGLRVGAITVTIPDVPR